MKITWKDLTTGEEGETDDFYWFEEEGIREVDNEWIGYGLYHNFKIKIVEN